MFYLHEFAAFLLLFFFAYFIFSIITILWQFVRHLSEPAYLIRTFKRRIMFLTYYLRTTLSDVLGLRSKALYYVLLTALLLLVSVEGYRLSGLSVTIDSYLEYPSAKIARYVQVQKADSDDSKYYSLPAQIIRYEESGDVSHYITRAYWPNGGYLDFATQNYGAESKVGSVVAAFDQNDVNYLLILTNEQAEHPSIETTIPCFNFSSFCSIIASLFLIVGYFPLKYPTYQYANDTTTTELPPLSKKNQ